jgi:hypothetical protein
MRTGLRRPFIRRLSAVWAVLWAASLLVCTLHCTLGAATPATSAEKHSCCAAKSGAQADSPASAKTACHTFRDLTTAEAASPRADYVAHVFALLDPAAFAPLVAAPSVLVITPPPEPDVGPPSHRHVMRPAGRAPPALV